MAVSPEDPAIAEMLRRASQEISVLTAPDGHEFLLAEIGTLAREVELIRQNDDLMRLLDERGAEPATVSIEEARARLGVD